MKGRTKAIILMGGLLGLLLFALCGVAMAAQQSATVGVSANVGQALSLSVNKSIANPINFGGGTLDPSVGTYNDALTATVSSNKSWTLQVSKDQDLTGGTSVIPSSQLTFTSSSSNPAVTPSSLKTGAQFGTGASPTTVAAGTKAGGIQVGVAYTLNITWNDDPVLYGATHTYTAVAP